MKRGCTILVPLATLGVMFSLACSQSGGAAAKSATPPPVAAASATPDAKGSDPRPIPAEKLALDPDAYSGVIAVSGRVTEIEPALNQFTLGCEDADSCVRIPVHFAGKGPAARTDVVVRGRLAKNPQGLYVLEADSVERP